MKPATPSRKPKGRWSRSGMRIVPPSTIRAVSGYASANFLHQIACAAGEGLPGRAYQAAKPVHWAHVDMASDFNLSPENLEAYRNGTMGLIPASAMGVPLQAGDRLLGILLLENFTAAEAFSRNTEEVALSLANQTALALEKARLFQEMTDRTRELDERASHLALLNRLTNAAITTSNERTLLQIACRELAAAFDVPQSAAAHDRKRADRSRRRGGIYLPWTPLRHEPERPAQRFLRRRDGPADAFPAAGGKRARRRTSGSLRPLDRTTPGDFGADHAAADGRRSGRPNPD